MDDKIEDAVTAASLLTMQIKKINSNRPLADIIQDLSKRVPEHLLSRVPNKWFEAQKEAQDRENRECRKRHYPLDLLPYDVPHKYIPWYNAVRILNHYAPGWIGEIRNIAVPGKSANTFVTVVYRITVKGSDGEVCREASATSTMDYGDHSVYFSPVQNAEREAFCKACVLFGLGLYLYHSPDAPPPNYNSDGLVKDICGLVDSNEGETESGEVFFWTQLNGEVVGSGRRRRSWSSDSIGSDYDVSTEGVDDTVSVESGSSKSSASAETSTRVRGVLSGLNEEALDESNSDLRSERSSSGRAKRRKLRHPESVENLEESEDDGSDEEESSDEIFNQLGNIQSNMHSSSISSRVLPSSISTLEASETSSARTLLPKETWVPSTLPRLTPSQLSAHAKQCKKLRKRLVRSPKAKHDVKISWNEEEVKDQRTDAWTSFNPTPKILFLEGSGIAPSNLDIESAVVSSPSELGAGRAKAAAKDNSDSGNGNRGVSRPKVSAARQRSLSLAAETRNRARKLFSVKDKGQKPAKSLYGEISTSSSRESQTETEVSFSSTEVITSRHRKSKRVKNRELQNSSIQSRERTFLEVEFESAEESTLSSEVSDTGPEDTAMGSKDSEVLDVENLNVIVGQSDIEVQQLEEGQLDKKAELTSEVEQDFASLRRASSSSQSPVEYVNEESESTQVLDCTIEAEVQPRRRTRAHRTNVPKKKRPPTGKSSYKEMYLEESESWQVDREIYKDTGSVENNERMHVNKKESRKKGKKTARNEGNSKESGSTSLRDGASATDDSKLVNSLWLTREGTTERSIQSAPTRESRGGKGKAPASDDGYGSEEVIISSSEFIKTHGKSQSRSSKPVLSTRKNEVKLQRKDLHGRRDRHQPNSGIQAGIDQAFVPQESETHESDEDLQDFRNSTTWSETFETTQLIEDEQHTDETGTEISEMSRRQNGKIQKKRKKPPIYGSKIGGESRESSKISRSYEDVKTQGHKEVEAKHNERDQSRRNRGHQPGRHSLHVEGWETTSADDYDTDTETLHYSGESDSEVPAKRQSSNKLRKRKVKKAEDSLSAKDSTPSGERSQSDARETSHDVKLVNFGQEKEGKVSVETLDSDRCFQEGRTPDYVASFEVGTETIYRSEKSDSVLDAPRETSTMTNRSLDETTPPTSSDPTEQIQGTAPINALAEKTQPLSEVPEADSDAPSKRVEIPESGVERRMDMMEDNKMDGTNIEKPSSEIPHGETRSVEPTVDVKTTSEKENKGGLEQRFPEKPDLEREVLQMETKITIFDDQTGSAGTIVPFSDRSGTEAQVASQRTDVTESTKVEYSDGEKHIHARKVPHEKTNISEMGVYVTSEKMTETEVEKSDARELDSERKVGQIRQKIPLVIDQSKTSGIEFDVDERYISHTGEFGNEADVALPMTTDLTDCNKMEPGANILFSDSKLPHDTTTCRTNVGQTFHTSDHDKVEVKPSDSLELCSEPEVHQIRKKTSVIDDQIKIYFDDRNSSGLEINSTDEDTSRGLQFETEEVRVVGTQIDLDAPVVAMASCSRFAVPTVKLIPPEGLEASWALEIPSAHESAVTVKHIPPEGLEADHDKEASWALEIPSAHESAVTVKLITPPEQPVLVMASSSSFAGPTVKLIPPETLEADHDKEASWALQIPSAHESAVELQTTASSTASGAEFPGPALHSSPESSRPQSDSENEAQSASTSGFVTPPEQPVLVMASSSSFAGLTVKLIPPEGLESDHDKEASWALQIPSAHESAVELQTTASPTASGAEFPRPALHISLESSGSQSDSENEAQSVSTSGFVTPPEQPVLVMASSSSFAGPTVKLIPPEGLEADHDKEVSWALQIPSAHESAVELQTTASPTASGAEFPGPALHISSESSGSQSDSENEAQSASTSGFVTPPEQPVLAMASSSSFAGPTVKLIPPEGLESDRDKEASWALEIPSAHESAVELQTTASPTASGAEFPVPTLHISPENSRSQSDSENEAQSASTSRFVTPSEQPVLARGSSSSFAGPTVKLIPPEGLLVDHDKEASWALQIPSAHESAVEIQTTVSPTASGPEFPGPALHISSESSGSQSDSENEAQSASTSRFVTPPEQPVPPESSSSQFSNEAKALAILTALSVHELSSGLKSSPAFNVMPPCSEVDTDGTQLITSSTDPELPTESLSSESAHEKETSTVSSSCFATPPEHFASFEGMSSKIDLRENVYDLDEFTSLKNDTTEWITPASIVEIGEERDTSSTADVGSASSSEYASLGENVPPPPDLSLKTGQMEEIQRILEMSSEIELSSSMKTSNSEERRVTSSPADVKSIDSLSTLGSEVATSISTVSPPEDAHPMSDGIEEIVSVPRMPAEYELSSSLKNTVEERELTAGGITRTPSISEVETEEGRVTVSTVDIGIIVPDDASSYLKDNTTERVTPWTSGLKTDAGQLRGSPLDTTQLDPTLGSASNSSETFYDAKAKFSPAETPVSVEEKILRRIPKTIHTRGTSSSLRLDTAKSRNAKVDTRQLRRSTRDMETASSASTDRGRTVARLTRLNIAQGASSVLKSSIPAGVVRKLEKKKRSIMHTKTTVSETLVPVFQAASRGLKSSTLGAGNHFHRVDVLDSGAQDEIAEVLRYKTYDNGVPLSRSDLEIESGVPLGGVGTRKASDYGHCGLRKVTPLNLGLETAGGVMTVIIPRNTYIPVQRRQLISTHIDNQTALLVHIFEGERLWVRDNNLLGSFEVKGIAPTPRGVPRITVRFDINTVGVLNVFLEGKKTIGPQTMKRLPISNVSVRPDKLRILEMIQDAEKHKVEDEENRRSIELKDSLENYVYRMRNLINDERIARLLDPEDKEQMMAAVNAALEWLRVSNWFLYNQKQIAEFHEVDANRRDLQRICDPILERLLRDQGPVGEIGSPPPATDQTV